MAGTRKTFLVVKDGNEWVVDVKLASGDRYPGPRFDHRKFARIAARTLTEGTYTERVAYRLDELDKPHLANPDPLPHPGTPVPPAVERAMARGR